MEKWFMECPYCKNEIKEWAIKCQYCWEFLDKDQAPSTEVPWQTVWQTKATKKKSNRVKRIFVIIVWIILWASLSSKDNTKTTNVDTKLQAVNSRIQHLKELYDWTESESTLIKVECENNNCKSHIMFYFDKDSIELDTFARWQAVNFSKDIQGPIYITSIVDWKFEKCFANNWQIKTDYENNWCKNWILQQ